MYLGLLLWQLLPNTLHEVVAHILKDNFSATDTIYFAIDFVTVLAYTLIATLLTLLCIATG